MHAQPSGQFSPGLTPRNGGFVPMIVRTAPAFTAWSGPATEPDSPAPDAIDPLDELLEQERAIAYQAGFEAGRTVAGGDAAEERQAIARLAEGLQALKPEPSGPLALLLVEAVDRLVRQVVGEVAIDPTLLLARAHAAAALIAEEAKPSAIRLHPADHARLDGAALPVIAIADATVTPGSVVMETAEGWVEDGIGARLDALRAALTRVAA